MSEPKVKLEIILVILLMGVAITGFWMTGYAMNAQMEALDQKIETVQTQTKANLWATIEIHDLIKQMKQAQAAAVAGPASSALSPGTSLAKK